MRFLVAVTLALATAGAAMAQRESTSLPERDAQLWFSTGVQLKPLRKKGAKDEQSRFFRDLQATGELGWKFNENASQLKQFNIDAGLRYPVLGFLRVGAEYRYSMRDRYTANRHRLDLQLWLKHKVGRLKADYRFEYEHSFREPRKLRTLLRNRIGLTYDIRKWKLDPFASAESFTALHYTGNRMIGIRYDLGTEMNLDKKKSTSLEVALRHDREMGVKRPVHSWILVLAVETSWKRK